MTPSAVRGTLEREPLHPFRIRASSGAACDLRNPGPVVVLKSRVFIDGPDSGRSALVPTLPVAGAELLADGHRPRSQRRPS